MIIEIIKILIIIYDHNHRPIIKLIIIAMSSITMIIDQVPGCSVHCTPGPSERCIKYTEFSANKLSYTSRYFRVKMVLMMNDNDGDQVHRVQCKLCPIPPINNKKRPMTAFLLKENRKLEQWKVEK